MVELLSPARDLTGLITAFNNGADSVYCGLKEMSMRKTAKNFDRNELIEGIKFAHSKNKRVYLCTNTVVYENDVSKLTEILEFAKSSEVDAVIVNDIGAMILAGEMGIEVHASVQNNITNSNTAKFYSKFAKRAVLSRELTLTQIKEIKKNLKSKNIDLELEGFIHGALCTAISGRCFLSSYLFNKNANCGDCLQPCRRNWKLINEHSDGTHELLCNGKYLLSPKDLSMIEYVPELIEVFDCFKIEGRAKNLDYVMRATKIYREAIDSIFDGSYFEKIPKFKAELEKVYNRGYDTGFYFRGTSCNSDIQYEFEGNISRYKKVEVGIALNYYKKAGVLEVFLTNDLKIGDEILIIGNTTGCIEEKVTSIQIDGKNIECAKKGQNVGIKISSLARENDKVYYLKNK
ncbi:peptidase U32 [Methanococcus vannielii SB]|uniref:Peptidase U32 n=1 Tax=Methanococcus vannielii (strain ATCC 35089 / DSM 1224 / JCM 13029 / OCM 148 / SB) TaxID=406327 RepID=A6USF3_METVS|nr:U32 family peptidase [Methanococcus vannielii]ABR55425.1 peptidase U32 [Methanococcus vannielii SB]